MNEISGSQFIITTFRVSVFGFASVLGGLAIWILTAELLRPASIELSTDAQYAVSMYEQRNFASTAAQIGLIRGDLWADAAFAYGDILLNDNYLSKADKVTIERTRALTEQAITYAPHDLRLWLLRALTYLPLDSLNDKTSASLKMSYYTGSNAIELIPERLLIATQSRALDDAEFRELVRHDIHIAVIYKSKLMPAIVAAYSNAPISGRQFIQKTLTEFDSAILPSTHSDGRPR